MYTLFIYVYFIYVYFIYFIYLFILFIFLCILYLFFFFLIFVCICLQNLEKEIMAKMLWKTQWDSLDDLWTSKDFSCLWSICIHLFTICYLLIGNHLRLRIWALKSVDDFHGTLYWRWTFTWVSRKKCWYTKYWAIPEHYSCFYTVSYSQQGKMIIKQYFKWKKENQGK